MSSVRCARTNIAGIRRLHIAAFASREVEFSIGSAPQVRSEFVQQVNRAEASRWQRLRFLWELAIKEAAKEQRCAVVYPPTHRATLRCVGSGRVEAQRAAIGDVRVTNM